MDTNYLARLNAEWDHTQHILIDWGDELPLSHCVCPGDTLSLVPTDPDLILSALIRIAQRGDQLATRTVVQAMLGKLVLMATRGRARSHYDALSDLVTALSMRVITYPLDRRPAKIAANLALDALAAAHRGWDVHELPSRHHDVAEEADRRPDPGDWVDEMPSAREVIGAGVRSGWLSPDLGGLMTAVYCEGLKGDEAARLWGCAPATVRSRCHQGVKILSAHTAELLCV